MRQSVKQRVATIHCILFLVPNLTMSVVVAGESDHQGVQEWHDMPAVPTGGTSSDEIPPGEARQGETSVPESAQKVPPTALMAPREPGIDDRALLSPVSDLDDEGAEGLILL